MLSKFYQSIVGRFLLNLPDSLAFEVWADPSISCSHHNGNRLLVRVPERYEALSLKTYEMIRYCSSEFDFGRLLKIDVTTVQSRFDSPEYAGRTPIDLERLLQFVKESPAERDYDGFHFHPQATRKNAETWATKKRGQIDYERLFGSGPMVPYFTGKAYYVSHAFTRFISQYGYDMAREHAEYFLGSEDVMIGRLFQRFASRCDGSPQPAAIDGLHCG